MCIVASGNEVGPKTSQAAERSGFNVAKGCRDLQKM